MSIPIRYYPSLNDALNNTNIMGYNDGDYVVGTLTSGTTGGYTSWRIASNSTGTSSQTAVYINGQTLNTDGEYYLYPAIPCFLEGTEILCYVDGEEKYIPVESIRRGTLVKTSRDGFKPVVLIGRGTIYNPSNCERIEGRLYRCPVENYPELTKDLVVTGCHSILVDKITDEEREKTIKSLGRIFITDRKYRLMSCIDERSKPYEVEGTFPIWHFALEHTDVSMNYGVYANGGLLVESSCIRFMRDKSNMEFF